MQGLNFSSFFGLLTVSIVWFAFPTIAMEDKDRKAIRTHEAVFTSSNSSTAIART